MTKRCRLHIHRGNSRITASPDDARQTAWRGREKKKACAKEFVDKSQATQKSCYLVVTFAANVRLPQCNVYQGCPGALLSTVGCQMAALAVVSYRLLCASSCNAHVYMCTVMWVVAVLFRRAVASSTGWLLEGHLLKPA